MSDPERCTECHAETPDPLKDDYTTVAFQDQIVALCSRCHEKPHYREEHPLEINPEAEVPSDLHLDSYYTITCATCHDPHGPHRSDERHVPAGVFDLVSSMLRRQEQFPTYFLRRPSVGGRLCLGCHQKGFGLGEGVEFSVETLPQYVGSDACRECHPAIHAEWSRSLHARNLRDSTEDRGAVRARFEGDQPFPPDEIRFTIGEHWTQRYVVEKPKGLMVRPEQWSLITEEWGKSAGSFSRPWLRYCAGCHTTALNPFDGSFLERGTGCEGCHGPGLRHIESTDQFDIVNPDVLVTSRRDMVCEACHTSGHDRSGRFRYPVGYRPGEDLTRFYLGLVPKAGQGAESYTGDGTYEDRHRQFEYLVSRLRLVQGSICDICTAHNRPEQAQGREGQEEYALDDNEMCGTCHVANFVDFEKHSGHDADQAGCLDCHPPMVNSTGTKYSIHDHKFQFGTPPEWVVQGEDPCRRCHADLPAGGGAAAL